MNKTLSFLFLLLLFSFGTEGQVIISEIMYNPPEGGTDSLEYIELYNAGDEAVDLTGYSFQQGVEYLFPDTTLAPNSFFLLVKSTEAMQNTLGITALQWMNGALNNGGEPIILQDSDSMEVNKVDFTTENPWPVNSDGTAGAGASIEFCMNVEDNSIGENWKASTNGTGVFINTFEFKGTPGSANSAVCATSNTITVVLTENVFTPKDITINVGETVLWKNEEGFHNVNGSTDTYPNNPEGFGFEDAASAPWEYEFTFTKEGIYDYRCDPHFDLGMIGTVTVEDNKPKLIITEIMYNDPSEDELDSLEFVEVYNAGDEDVSLGGIVFSTNLISFTLPDSTLGAGDFLIIQKEESVFIKSTGLLAISFSSAGLDNNSDSVVLTTAEGEEIDRVNYMDREDWPEAADGFGSSLSLCNLNADNNDPSNWKASETPTGRFYGDGTELLANPGQLYVCSFSIPEASEVDSNGVVIKEGFEAIIAGLVYGVNMRPGGLQFTIIDNKNEGIAVFSASENFGYTVEEGDSIRVEGEISQFNGLVQINLESVEFISANNLLIESDTVAVIDESTESSLVTIRDVQLIDPSQWTSSGSGFNVEIANETDTFELRIDADVADLYNAGYPTGIFTVTGIGGQFDNSEPYLSGYQLLPRYAADLNPFVPFIESYPLTSIEDASEVDENGVATMLDEQVEIRGVTHGINYRPSGLQFTIIDEDNDGIGLFLNSGDLGYDYNEGDLISIKGSISQFNGLTQISPDSISFLGSENALMIPTEVTSLGEETESQLIKIVSGEVVNPSQWQGDGGSFNVEVQIAGGALVEMRIDSDTDLANMPLPGTVLMITGIGGQFDNSEPYLDGYQLLPRYESDITLASDVEDLFLPEDYVVVYPNPASTMLSFEKKIDINNIIIYDVLGRRVMHSTGNVSSIDIAQLSNGKYFIQFISESGIVQKDFVKQ